jgi:NAD(P)-dependent dehydrogenase (short-subunit alcohol dehydrogenase family)
MSVKLKPIEQQVVVLMGASSGIGRATALRFARRGARLVIAARNDQDLATLAQELRALGAQVVDITADTADYAQVVLVAERAVEAFGRIDTWVHLAGVSIYAPFERITPEEFRQVIEVNLMGQVYGAMAALPCLRREGRGALIHVSSVLGERSVPLQSPYCASKHGLNGFVESLRSELAHEGLPINVVNIMPSSINTPFYDKAKTKLGVMPAPIPPVYDPDSVADAILYGAENPARDLVVGGGGQALIWGQRISPTLTDMFIDLYAFPAQQSKLPKAPDAPNNLFGPVEGQGRVEGAYGHMTRRNSVYTQLETNPAAAGALNALGGVAALLALPGLAVAAGAMSLAAGATMLVADALEAISQPADARRAARFVDERVQIIDMQEAEHAA